MAGQSNAGLSAAARLRRRPPSQRDRGGKTFHDFEVKYPRKTLAIRERDMPDGKIEQFQVMARD